MKWGRFLFQKRTVPISKKEKIMIEILQETIIDTIKLIPFLFITYLIMEYIENKTSKKIREKIKKSGKFGPIIGGIVRNFTTMWIFCICN